MLPRYSSISPRRFVVIAFSFCSKINLFYLKMFSFQLHSLRIFSLDVINWVGRFLFSFNILKILSSSLLTSVVSDEIPSGNLSCCPTISLAAFKYSLFYWFH